MSILGFGRIGACLLVLVAGASSQNFQPLPSTPSDGLIDRVDSQPRSDAVHRELQFAGDYMAGRGVPKNVETAAYWYRKAADQGDPGAQNQLGYLYLTGLGVQADEVQAFKWFARAAGSGFEPAKLNVAVMYMHGQGVARDPALAFQMLQDLAAKRNPIAEDYLGIAYYTGTGVKIDHSLGEKWFDRAARQHDPEGEFDMGVLDSFAPGHPQDFVRAAAYFRSSAEGGYVNAMHLLGLLLVMHPELPRTPDEVEKLIVTAAQSGFWRSSLLLGIMARDGTGRPADEAEAYRWFLIAAGQGGQEAQKMLVNDLAACRAALDPKIQTKQQQQADAWLQEHRTKISFLFGDRFRKQAFPIAEIRDSLSPTLN